MKSIQGFWLGVVVASVIHGVYNIYISQNVMIPSVILIIGFLFSNSSCSMICGTIRNTDT